MDDDALFDVYNDLDEFDYQVKYDEEKKEKKELQKQLDESREKVQGLEKEKEELLEKLTNYERSFHSLLETARAEIKRKDNKISEMQREMDNIVFRRNKNPNKQLQERKNANEPAPRNFFNKSDKPDVQQNRVDRQPENFEKVKKIEGNPFRREPNQMLHDNPDEKTPKPFSQPSRQKNTNKIENKGLSQHSTRNCVEGTNRDPRTDTRNQHNDSQQNGTQLDQNDTIEPRGIHNKRNNRIHPGQDRPTAKIKDCPRDKNVPKSNEGNPFRRDENKKSQDKPNKNISKCLNQPSSQHNINKIEDRRPSDDLPNLGTHNGEIRNSRSDICEQHRDSRVIETQKDQDNTIHQRDFQVEVTGRLRPEQAESSVGVKVGNDPREKNESKTNEGNLISTEENEMSHDKSDIKDSNGLNRSSKQRIRDKESPNILPNLEAENGAKDINWNGENHTRDQQQDGQKGEIQLDHDKTIQSCDERDDRICPELEKPSAEVIDDTRDNNQPKSNGVDSQHELINDQTSTNNHPANKPIVIELNEETANDNNYERFDPRQNSELRANERTNEETANDNNYERFDPRQNSELRAKHIHMRRSRDEFYYNQNASLQQMHPIDEMNLVHHNGFGPNPDSVKDNNSMYLNETQNQPNQLSVNYVEDHESYLYRTRLKTFDEYLENCNKILQPTQTNDTAQDTREKDLSSSKSNLSKINEGIHEINRNPSNKLESDRKIDGTDKHRRKSIDHRKDISEKTDTNNVRKSSTESESRDPRRKETERRIRSPNRSDTNRTESRNNIVSSSKENLPNSRRSNSNELHEDRPDRNRNRQRDEDDSDRRRDKSQHRRRDTIDERRIDRHDRDDRNYKNDDRFSHTRTDDRSRNSRNVERDDRRSEKERYDRERSRHRNDRNETNLNSDGERNQDSRQRDRTDQRSENRERRGRDRDRRDDRRPTNSERSHRTDEKDEGHRRDKSVAKRDKSASNSRKRERDDKHSDRSTKRQKLDDATNKRKEVTKVDATNFPDDMEACTVDDLDAMRQMLQSQISAENEEDKIDNETDAGDCRKKRELIDCDIFGKLDKTLSRDSTNKASASFKHKKTPTSNTKSLPIEEGEISEEDEPDAPKPESMTKHSGAGKRRSLQNPESDRTNKNISDTPESPKKCDAVVAKHPPNDKEHKRANREDNREKLKSRISDKNEKQSSHRPHSLTDSSNRERSTTKIEVIDKPKIKSADMKAINSDKPDMKGEHNEKMNCSATPAEKNAPKLTQEPKQASPSKSLFSQDNESDISSAKHDPCDSNQEAIQSTIVRKKNDQNQLSSIEPKLLSNKDGDTKSKPDGVCGISNSVEKENISQSHLKNDAAKDFSEESKQKSSNKDTTLNEHQDHQALSQNICLKNSSNDFKEDVAKSLKANKEQSPETIAEAPAITSNSVDTKASSMNENELKILLESSFGKSNSEKELKNLLESCFNKSNSSAAEEKNSMSPLNKSLESIIAIAKRQSSKQAIDLEEFQDHMILNEIICEERNSSIDSKHESRKSLNLNDEENPEVTLDDYCLTVSSPLQSEKASNQDKKSSKIILEDYIGSNRRSTSQLSNKSASSESMNNLNRETLSEIGVETPVNKPKLNSSEKKPKNKVIRHKSPKCKTILPKNQNRHDSIKIDLQNENISDKREENNVEVVPNNEQSIVAETVHPSSSNTDHSKTEPEVITVTPAKSTLPKTAEKVTAAVECPTSQSRDANYDGIAMELEKIMGDCDVPNATISVKTKTPQHETSPIFSSPVPCKNSSAKSSRKSAKKNSSQEENDSSLLNATHDGDQKKALSSYELYLSNHLSPIQTIILADENSSPLKIVAEKKQKSKKSACGLAANIKLTGHKIDGFEPTDEDDSDVPRDLKNNLFKDVISTDCSTPIRPKPVRKKKLVTPSNKSAESAAEKCQAVDQHKTEDEVPSPEEITATTAKLPVENCQKVVNDPSLDIITATNKPANLPIENCENVVEDKTEEHVEIVATKKSTDLVEENCRNIIDTSSKETDSSSVEICPINISTKLAEENCQEVDEDKTNEDKTNSIEQGTKNEVISVDSNMEPTPLANTVTSSTSSEDMPCKDEKNCSDSTDSHSSSDSTDNSDSDSDSGSSSSSESSTENDDVDPVVSTIQSKPECYSEISTIPNEPTTANPESSPKPYLTKKQKAINQLVEERKKRLSDQNMTEENQSVAEERKILPEQNMLVENQLVDESKKKLSDHNLLGENQSNPESIKTEPKPRTKRKASRSFSENDPPEKKQHVVVRKRVNKQSISTDIFSDVDDSVIDSSIVQNANNGNENTLPNSVGKSSIEQHIWTAPQNHIQISPTDRQILEKDLECSFSDLEKSTNDDIKESPVDVAGHDMNKSGNERNIISDTHLKAPCNKIEILNVEIIPAGCASILEKNLSPEKHVLNETASSNTTDSPLSPVENASQNKSNENPKSVTRKRRSQDTNISNNWIKPVVGLSSQNTVKTNDSKKRVTRATNRSRKINYKEQLAETEEERNSSDDEKNSSKILKSRSASRSISSISIANSSDVSPNSTLNGSNFSADSSLNDSQSEKKVISTKFSDYLIEKVDNNVVNVFITRKKVKKKKKT